MYLHSLGKPDCLGPPLASTAVTRDSISESKVASTDEIEAGWAVSGRAPPAGCPSD